MYGHESEPLQHIIVSHHQPWLTERGGLYAMILHCTYTNNLPTLYAIAPTVHTEPANIMTLTHAVHTATNPPISHVTDESSANQPVQSIDHLLIDLLHTAINLISLIPFNNTFHKLLHPLSNQQIQSLNLLLLLPYLQAQLDTSAVSEATRSIVNQFSMQLNNHELTTVLQQYSHNYYHSVGIDRHSLLWYNVIDIIGTSIQSESIILYNMLLCDIMTCMDGGVWLTQSSVYIDAYQYNILQLIDILCVNQFGNATIIHSQFHSQQLFQRIGKFALHRKLQLNQLSLQILSSATQRVHGLNCTRWCTQLNQWKSINHKHQSGYIPNIPQTPLSRLMIPLIHQSHHKNNNTMSISISTQTRGSDMNTGSYITPSVAITASTLPAVNESTSKTTPLEIIVDEVEADDETILQYDDRRTSMPNGQLNRTNACTCTCISTWTIMVMVIWSVLMHHSAIYLM